MKFILPTFVLVLLSYAMAINTGLLGDDITWIVDGTELKTLWNAIIGTLADRPLLMTLIWLQKSIYGLYPMYLRIANIGIHTLASWQLFKLIQEVTPLPDVNKTKIAAIAAVLFAIHPLHSQTLMITIQTGVTLAGLFGILSFRYFLIFTETGKKKNVQVKLVDAYNNTRIVQLSLTGADLDSTRSDGAAPPKAQVSYYKNIMKIKVAQSSKGGLAKFEVGNTSYEILPAYQDAASRTYLWDLRFGIPKNIDLCSEIYTPDIIGHFPVDREHLHANSKLQIRIASNRPVIDANRGR